MGTDELSFLYVCRFLKWVAFILVCKWVANMRSTILKCCQIKGWNNLLIFLEAWTFEFYQDVQGVFI